MCFHERDANSWAAGELLPSGGGGGTLVWAQLKGPFLHRCTKGGGWLSMLGRGVLGAGSQFIFIPERRCQSGLHRESDGRRDATSSVWTGIFTRDEDAGLPGDSCWTGCGQGQDRNMTVGGH